MNHPRLMPSPAELEGISVFFPAYNDAPTIGGLVQTVHALLRRHGAHFEIIVVNDGSRDGTAGVLSGLEAELGPTFRVVTHPANRGYGAALRSGFSAARLPWVFYTDGDAQYDVSELAALLPHAADDVGLVNGYKLRRHDPRHRIWIGRLYNRVARALFGIRLRDVDCDFRLVRRRLLSSGQLRSNGGTICVELALAAEASGLRVVEVPVHHYSRRHGQSQFFRLRPLLATLFELVRLFVARLARRMDSPAPIRPVEGD
jgi:glycosyltransferase involved in cell wall biosynthesis